MLTFTEFLTTTAQLFLRLRTHDQSCLLIISRHWLCDFDWLCSDAQNITLGWGWGPVPVVCCDWNGKRLVQLG